MSDNIHPRSYSCERCEALNLSEQEFLNHVQANHTDIQIPDLLRQVPQPTHENADTRRYGCETCGLHQLSGRDFIQHVQRTHPSIQVPDALLEPEGGNQPSTSSNIVDRVRPTNAAAAYNNNLQARELDAISEELLNYRRRMCTLCGIYFAIPGELDAHQYRYHRQMVIGNQFEQVGGGMNHVNFVEVNAFDGLTREYTADLGENVFVDAAGVFLHCSASLQQLMQTVYQEIGSYLITSVAIVEMMRLQPNHPNSFQVEEFPFRSFLHTCLHPSTFPNIVRLMRNKIEQTLAVFIEKGSGWRIVRFLSITFKFTVHRMQKGRGWLPTPNRVAARDCIVNVRNSDEYCFKYAILAELNPMYKDDSVHWYQKTDPRNYESFPNTIVWNCINFPMTLDQMDTFLNENPTLSVNVYGYEESDELDPKLGKQRMLVFPLYVCREKRQRHIDLLLLIVGNESHFVLLKQTDENPSYGLSRLLGKEAGNHAKFICNFCLHYWGSIATLQRHQKYCIAVEPQGVCFPRDKYFSFKQVRNTLPVPFVIICDFESILKPSVGDGSKRIGQVINEHLDCGYAFVILGPNGRPATQPISYCGKNAANDLILKLLHFTKPYFAKLQEDVGRDPQYTQADFLRMRTAARFCIHCGEPFRGVPGQVVIDHCHITGRIRGPSCNSCNLQRTVPQFIPIVFHNLRNYDGHFIVQALRSEMFKFVLPTPISQEKFTCMECITHDGSKLKFIDSYQFLNSSLADQVSMLAKKGREKFVTLQCVFAKHKEHMDLLFQKGVYPYVYMDSFEKLDSVLPEIGEFRSDLTGDISEQDYGRAVEVWEKFDCKTMRDYHNLYVMLDVCQLSDCFQDLRQTMMTNFRLDPAHYITLPGIAYDAAMLCGQVEYEHLRDGDMYMWNERGIRGGNCSVGLRYAKANNPYMGSLHDPRKPTTYLILLDANLLYSTCLKFFVPFKHFRWDPSLHERTQRLDLVVAMLMRMGDEAREGLILEVDLDYPNNLHDLHNDYPLAVERGMIEFENLSPYTRQVMQNVGQTPTSVKKSKLMGTFHPKRNYIVHYRVLKLYLQLGLKLVKVHCALRFTQAPLIRPYIDMCIERRRNATNPVDQKFWKTMGNVVFGKLLQNVRKYKRINIALNRQKAFEYGKKVTVKNFKILHDECVLFMMKKMSVCLNKHISAGLTVLDDSKRIMYDFYYNVLKAKYGGKMRLVMTDTDSLLLYVETEDIYNDMYEMMQSPDCKLDTSNYDPNHPTLGKLSSQEHQGKCGFFKDEFANSIITEVVALKPKLYSIKSLDKDNILRETKKAKGTVRAVVRDELRFADYLRVLDESTTHSVNMNTIRSLDHRVFTTTLCKQSLSALEDKSGYYISPLESLRFGHYKIAEYQEEVEEEL